MKLVFYCQHIWGVGHFFRTLEICRALAGHQVILITGGADIERKLPDHVRPFRLPGLMTDRNFQGLFPTDSGRSLEAVCRERQQLLRDLFARERPDVFVIELYPFGRRAFRFELEPILEDCRSGRLQCGKVICSLRDILVEKRHAAAYEADVVTQLNRYFDALLIHADPALVPLDLTFSRLGDITIPVVYTGYIAPRIEPQDAGQLKNRLHIPADEDLIVASVGGGKVGIVLMEPLLEGFKRLDPDPPVTLRAFTGPYMPEEEFRRLSRYSGPRVTVKRFTARFLTYLGAARLSVSMGGYNTCMNILATGVPALVWPYPGDREQGLRAERLAAIGALEVLEDGDLQPERLAGRMAAALSRRSRSTGSIDLDGARRTARWLVHHRMPPARGEG